MTKPNKNGDIFPSNNPPCGLRLEDIVGDTLLEDLKKDFPYARDPDEKNPTKTTWGIAGDQIKINEYAHERGSLIRLSMLSIFDFVEDEGTPAKGKSILPIYYIDPQFDTFIDSRSWSMFRYMDCKNTFKLFEAFKRERTRGIDINKERELLKGEGAIRKKFLQTDKEKSMNLFENAVYSVERDLIASNGTVLAAQNNIVKIERLKGDWIAVQIFNDAHDVSKGMVASNFTGPRSTLEVFVRNGSLRIIDAHIKPLVEATKINEKEKERAMYTKDDEMTIAKATEDIRDALDDHDIDLLTGVQKLIAIYRETKSTDRFINNQIERLGNPRALRNHRGHNTIIFILSVFENMKLSEGDLYALADKKENTYLPKDQNPQLKRRVARPKYYAQNDEDIDMPDGPWEDRWDRE